MTPAQTKIRPAMTALKIRMKIMKNSISSICMSGNIRFPWMIRGLAAFRLGRSFESGIVVTFGGPLTNVRILAKKDHDRRYFFGMA